MATYGHTFTSGDTLTPTKLNNARTVTNIVNADISASAAIALSKLANITSGQVLLGNASNVPTSTAVTGDVTISNTGVTAIGAGVIVNADINASAAIAGTKIAPNFGSQNIETTGSVSSGPGSTFTGSSSGGVLRITQTGAGNALVVEDSTSPDATPFVIDATGAVVCGHTSAIDASNALEVVGNSRRGVTIYSYSSNLTLGYPVLNLARSPSGSIGSAALLTSNLIGEIRFEANDGTEFIQAARVFAAVDGTTGSGDMPGRLVFATTPDGGTTATERVRIDSAGNVGIGGTANAAAILDAASTTKGFLPPRMTTAQRDAISTPPAGLMIYNTTTNKLNVYTTAWEAVTSS